jgi:predicted protein tyrosine phosphatase
VKDMKPEQEIKGNIIICRADEVRGILEKSPAVVAVLSIEHPGVEPGASGHAPRLDSVPQKILTFWDSEILVQGGPDEAQVAAGMDFIVENLRHGDVIVHCHAGKSRSCGVALGALAVLYPEDTAEALVDRLLVTRPIAAPNIIVVALADHIADCGGTLLRAVEENRIIAAQRAEAEKNRARWRERNPEKCPPLVKPDRPKGPAI